MHRYLTGWRHHGRLAAGAAAGALVIGTALAGAAPAAAAGGPVAPTLFGAVQGKTVNGVNEFLGIPYAAPPVGALRWHAPKLPARWHGIRQATAFGPHCPQSAGAFGIASTTENCLFLNVFTKPGRSLAGRPVMVWIHGGALVSGESNDFDPTALVNDGVTVVTINYRLGALGFLANSALANQQGDAGNYGLMDQQAALRWVKANIRFFGGNPFNVTLFGESAGGLSVLSQLDSPLARGLFQRAIVESGSYDLVQATLDEAEASGNTFAARTGCTQSTPAAVAACLRALPVSTILASQGGGETPDLDGRVLRQSILTALQTGEFNRVPVIMGTNHDEWRLFVGLGVLAGAPEPSAANYAAEIAGTAGTSSPAIIAEIEAKYPLSGFASAADAVGAVGTDKIFACPSLEAVSLLSQFTPTFSYEFNDENAPERFVPSNGFDYGAAHASEIQYLFNITTPVPGPLSAAQQVLAAQMKGYWTSQARFGKPATFRQPAWPLFNATTQRMLSLDEPAPAVETNFSAEHNCAFWTTVDQQIASGTA
jgi:para-nitrobenzyl esterase